MTFYLNTRVTWKGEQLSHTGVQWSQDGQGNLPPGCGVLSGYSQWTASFSMVPTADKAPLEPLSPWNQDYPRPGDRVDIDIELTGHPSLGDKTYNYWGIVDNVTYNDSEVSVSLISAVDGFSNTVRTCPLFFRMPRTPTFPRPYESRDETAERDDWALNNDGWVTGSGFNITGKGKNYNFSPWYSTEKIPAVPRLSWLINEAFKAAGYNITQPPVESTVLLWPMQGSGWINTWASPKQGFVYKLGEAYRSNDIYNTANKHLQHADGAYWWGGGTAYAAPAEMTSADTYHFGFSYCTFKGGGSADLRIKLGSTSLNEDETFILKNDGSCILSMSNKGTKQTAVWNMRGVVNVSLIRRGTFWELKVKNRKTGEEITRSGNGPSRALKITRVVIWTESGSWNSLGVNGLRLDSAAEHGGYHEFIPNARLENTAGDWPQELVSSVRDKSAREVLDGIAEATLSSWWVDGQGIAHWVFTEAQPPAPTLTVPALTELSSYSISDSLQNYRETIEIKYSELSGSWGESDLPSCTVWSLGGTLQPGEEGESFFGPDEKTEWIYPDMRPLAYFYMWKNDKGQTYHWSDFKGFEDFEVLKKLRFAASMVGGTNWNTLDDKAIEERTVAGDAPQYYYDFQEITPWQWKFTDSNRGDDWQIHRKVGPGSLSGENWDKPPQGADGKMLRPIWNMALPRINAKGKISHTDKTYKRTGGLAHAGTLTINGAPWITRESYCERIANILQDGVFSPNPILDSVELLFNPSIKISDSITIEGIGTDGAENVFGATIDAVVIAATHNAEKAVTTLTVRVTNIRNINKGNDWSAFEHRVDEARQTWQEQQNRITNSRSAWVDTNRTPNLFFK